MKIYTSFYRSAVLLLALTTCSLLYSGCKKKDDSNNTVVPPPTATSTICDKVTGTEAIYWDLMNGIPRTDIPGGLPVIAQVGGSYTHPSYPLLSFTYPPGYTPQTDPNSGYIGVNLFRNDNKSVWRYTSLFYTGTATPQDVLNLEVTSLKTLFGSTGTVTTLCSQQGTLPRAPGITTNHASVYIQFDGFSATINVSITTETGLGAEQVNIVTTAAPTNEFANEILHTYLPIDYQLLYKDNGETDSDGDGYPDSQDNAPYDAGHH